MNTMSSAFRQFQPPQLIAALLLQQGKSRHIPSAFLPTPAQPKPIEPTLMAPARHLFTIQTSSCNDYCIPTVNANGSHHKERLPIPPPSFPHLHPLHTSVPMSTTRAQLTSRPLRVGPSDIAWGDAIQAGSSGGNMDSACKWGS